MYGDASGTRPPKRPSKSSPWLEAEDTLAFVARRREQDPVIDAFENAPLDDEPITRKKSWASDEARETYRRGETKRDRSSVHLL